VAQRRRRVFVVGYLGNWQPAAAVLFERHSLSGHLAPSREKREGVAAYAREGAASSKWPAEISSTLDTTFGTKQGLEDQHVNAGCPMFVPAIKTLVGLQDCNNFSSEITGKIVTREGCAADTAHMVMQPIALAENTIGRKPENGGNGDGFTEEGPMYTLNATGVHGVAQPIPLNSMNCFRSPDADASTGCGIGEAGEAMFTITKANSHAVAQPIAFSGQMSNPQTDVDMTQTLGAKNPMAVMHSIGTDIYNGAITGDVAVPLTNRSDGTGTGPTVMQSVVAPTLTAANDPSRSPQSSEVTQQVYSVLQASMAVRRLTPKECERLQGFPDNYTDIKPKGKATPDGPRYKALGNSMAVPVMAWIGKRIQEVDAICQTQKQ